MAEKQGLLRVWMKMRRDCQRGPNSSPEQVESVLRNLDPGEQAHSSHSFYQVGDRLMDCGEQQQM